MTFISTSPEIYERRCSLKKCVSFNIYFYFFYIIFLDGGQPERSFYIGFGHDEEVTRMGCFG